MLELLGVKLARGIKGRIEAIVITIADENGLQLDPTNTTEVKLHTLNYDS